MKQRVISILIFLLAGSFSASAQLYPYNWRLGVSAGYSTYFGDLSPFQVNGLGEADKLFRMYDFNTNYIPQPSFQISLEARLSNTVGFALKGGRYSFAMADRFVNRKDELQTDTPNFIRSLNFKTDVTDIGISFLFSADNGKILNKKAFMAPYLGIGAGVLWYDVFADLYDSDGMPYDYSDLEVNYNGDYETELRPLRTEGVGYANHAFYGELSLGLRFRLAHRWELFIQSDFRYTTTDYLDDVSGQYRTSYTTQEQQYAANPINLPENGGDNLRGNNNGLNDFYLYHGAGLKFSFGHRKESFRAPVINGQHWQRTADTGPTPEPKRQLPRAEPVKAPVDLQKEKPDLVVRDEKLDELIEPTMRFLENEMVLLEMRERERRLSAREDSLRNIQANLDSLHSTLEAHLDSVPNDSVAQQQLAQQTAEKEVLKFQLDSLYRARVALIEDSLSKNQSEEPLVIEESPVEDTIRVEPEIIRTTADSLQRAEMIQMQRRMERMQQQQAARDSVIIMRLADLIDEQQAATTTEKSVVEKYYTDTAGVSQRSTIASPRSGSSGEVESLRREVRSLREAIDSKQQAPTYTPAPDRGRDVTVVPGAPVIIREGSRDTLRASEYEAMQRERERLKSENEALRKELEQKEFELDLFLNPPKVGDQQESTDTLAAVTISEPADTLQNAEANTTANREVQTLERLRETAKTLEAENKEKERNQKAAEETISPEPEESESKESPDLESPDLEPMQVNVFFALNSTSVQESDKAKLRQAADHWKKETSQTISLTSYADNTGNPEYNKQLCARRNHAVKTVLVEEYGVEADKIKTEVGGKVVRNGKAWNPDDRRVELVVRSVE